MGYRLKSKAVDAMLVVSILETARTDFSALPCWIKKAFQEGKIFFGFSEIEIYERHTCRSGVAGDFIVRDPDHGLKVFKEKDFNKFYEQSNE